MRQLVILAFALCLVLLCTGPSSFVAAADADPAPTEAEFKKMKVNQLKSFLKDRGVTCESCAEKTDFIRECLKNANTPLIPSKVKSTPKGLLWEAWANVAHEVCEATAATRNVDAADKELICNNIKTATESVFMQYGKRTAGKLRKKPEALLKTSFGDIYQDAGKKMLGKLAAYCFHAKNKDKCASSSKLQDLLENDDKVKGVKIVTYLTNVGIENTNPMYETLKNKALDKDEL